MPHRNFPIVLASYFTAPLQGSPVSMNLQSAPFFGASVSKEFTHMQQANVTSKISQGPTTKDDSSSKASIKSKGSTSTQFLSNFQKLKTQTQQYFAEFVWFVRVMAFLSIACNTLFVGLAVVLLPFILFEVQVAAAIVCVIITLYFPSYLGDPATTGRRKWEAFQKSFLIKDLVKYFHGDVVKTADIPSDQQYIFAVAPHGVVPLSCLWMLSHEKWKSYFPSIDAVPLGSSVFHFAPLIRDFAMWSGTRQVTKKSFEHTFKEGKSVVMIPGGIAELKYSKSTSKVIELCGRHHGFVRMALKHGTPLVPVFSFGETLTFDVLEVPLLSKLLYKYLKMPFPYFTGIGGFLQLPRRKPITVVVGAPIMLEKDENPSEEKIKQLHKRFYDELTELFEKNKHNHGHGDFTLKVHHAEESQKTKRGH